jgi:hypothetical protein
MKLGTERGEQHVAGDHDVDVGSGLPQQTTTSWPCRVDARPRAGAGALGDQQQVAWLESSSTWASSNARSAPGQARPAREAARAQVAGQRIASVPVDRHGRRRRRPITPTRLLGVAVLLAGVGLVQLA